MGNLIEKYLSKMNLTGTELFSQSEANQLMNENVIGLYKGCVSLRENKEFTAKEIAEKLAFIESEWRKKFDEKWKEVIGDQK
ncbi:hypothetical protein [Bacillus cereus]|uniref:hypothetical protein n=1 Tax=Bacillus cereus TaxID=1396 RepID=UPI000BF8FEAC|nr:hypothetical protein [Bacillus cereus]PEY77799.1 hypothetical protein CN344_16190 [Bacillus cereus]PGL14359.1 hypothetical protein CN912_06090 [Bacillus cereus]PGP76650.1 hypothetical protein CN999_26375 [Bacillus cereus]